MNAFMQRERQEQQLFGLDDDYSLPINHRANDALETSDLVMASLDIALGEDNKGYQMLQRMGWSGKGLGRNEDGMCLWTTHRGKHLAEHAKSRPPTQMSWMAAILLLFRHF